MDDIDNLIEGFNASMQRDQGVDAIAYAVMALAVNAGKIAQSIDWLHSALRGSHGDSLTQSNEAIASAIEELASNLVTEKMGKALDGLASLESWSRR